MASIGGLTSSTSSSLTGTNSLKGYGGLASGLDRDSLIEAMTSGTQSKIQKQKQQKQIVEWQQEAIRNITDKMYDFTQKYTSYTSSTNLLSSSFFSRNDITSQGVNSKYVSVSGNSPLIDNISVLGVKQLAENAKLTSTGTLSDQVISGTINKGLDPVKGLNETISTNNLAGKSFSIKFGESEYSFTIPADAKVGDVKDTIDTLNGLIDNNPNLKDKIVFEDNGAQGIKIMNKDSNYDLRLVSGEDVFKYLGILGENDSLDSDKVISPGGSMGNSAADLVKNTSVKDILKETTLSFNFNGETKNIKLDESANFTDMKGYVGALQDAINKAYGSGNIKVELNEKDNKLSFTTVNDDYSTLSINSSSISGVLGKDGILGIEAGASNRLNVDQTLESLGGFTFDSEGKGSLTVNDTEIEFTKDMTLQDLMSKIEKEAGVKITYLSSTDKVTVSSLNQGAGVTISFGDSNGDANAKALMELFKLTKDAEGNDISTSMGNGADVAKGKDAIMTLKYNNTDEPITVHRNSNTIKIDDLEFSLTGTFGTYDSTDEIDEAASTDGAVTFSAKASADETTTAVKGMIDAFNEIVSLVNATVNEKQSGSDKYEPLTDQQKEEMTESQITAWEKKAKVGILYNDTELRGLASALRFVLPSGADRQALADIGISVSSDYGDNGKLVFDETKFKKAMETNPDKVKELIAGFTSDGTKTSNGLMNNIQNVMDQYAKTTGATKGILIQRAGSTKAPLSVIQNSMQKQIENIQKVIEQLQDRLESEQSRYISQFTRLETVIANMNAQSSWLSQLQ